MKMSILAGLVVILSACDQQVTPGETKGVDSSSWTARERENVQQNCESAVTRTPNFSSAYASAYCRCVFESVESRWTPDDMGLREAEILNTLRTEGAIAKCLQAGQTAQDGRDSMGAGGMGTPFEIVGVRLEMPIDELLRARPRAIEKEGSFIEPVDWNESGFEAHYEVNPISNTVMMVTLERTVTREEYFQTHSHLQTEFGTFPQPIEVGLWALRSEKASRGMFVIHGLKASTGDLFEEVIMLGKSP